MVSQAILGDVHMYCVLTGEGTGHGGGPGKGCSGGGHGGGGGKGADQIRSGAPFGSYLQPRSFGCDGGNSTFPYVGGAGGGRLSIEASDWLTIDGRVSASGGRGRSPHSGGGSGGSVFARTRHITGAGVVEASGGDGDSRGGGGSAGRVAIYYVYDFFVGKSFVVFSECYWFSVLKNCHYI